jgi:hypothetical protein
MPGGSRTSADAKLIALLAGGMTVAGAAITAKVSEATIYRRLKDPRFQAKIESARRDFLERALAGLAAGANEAVVTLRALLREDDPKLKHAVARSILELGGALREERDLAERLAALEELLARRKGKAK